MLHNQSDTLLEGLEKPLLRYSCRVAVLMSELSNRDGEILSEAIKDVQGWPHRSLSNALAERGLVLADTTIARHRKGQCACGRANNA
jgi:hypothetical protein